MNARLRRAQVVGTGLIGGSVGLALRAQGWHVTGTDDDDTTAGRAAEHGAVLRLAAGGFRDMTRVAAGHPGIWPDICAENREAIVDVLDDLIAALGRVRGTVETGDGASLAAMLSTARAARLNLP